MDSVEETSSSANSEREARSASSSAAGGVGFPGILFLAGAVEGQASTGWDQAADDDVFLQAAQAILLAHDRCFGQHAGGFLERCGRDEGVGRQRCLGNTQQHVFIGRRDLAFGGHAVVLVQQLGALDLLTGDVVGVARLHHLHAAQHLAHDHFNVLVVDLHALQTIHVLHFVHHVTGQRFHALQTQDVMRIGRAVNNQFTALTT
jgi:hypothetical protein